MFCFKKIIVETRSIRTTTTTCAWSICCSFFYSIFFFACKHGISTIYKNKQNQKNRKKMPHEQLQWVDEAKKKNQIKETKKKNAQSHFERNYTQKKYANEHVNIVVHETVKLTMRSRNSRRKRRKRRTKSTHIASSLFCFYSRVCTAFFSADPVRKTWISISKKNTHKNQNRTAVMFLFSFLFKRFYALSLINFQRSINTEWHFMILGFWLLLLLLLYFS